MLYQNCVSASSAGLCCRPSASSSSSSLRSKNASSSSSVVEAADDDVTPVAPRPAAVVDEDSDLVGIRRRPMREGEDDKAASVCVG